MKLLFFILQISFSLCQVQVSQNSVSTSGNGAYAVSSSGGQVQTSSNGQSGQMTQAMSGLGSVTNGVNAIAGSGIQIPAVIASAGGVSAIAGNIGAFASTGSGASTWSGTTVNGYDSSYAYAGPDGTYTNGNGAASSLSGQKISTSTSGNGAVASAYSGGNGLSQTSTSTSTTTYINGKLVTYTTHQDNTNPSGSIESTSTSSTGQNSYSSSTRTYDIGQGCTVTEKTETINGKTEIYNTYTGPNCVSYQQQQQNSNQKVKADTTDQYVQDYSLGDTNTIGLKQNITKLAEQIKQQVQKFNGESILSFAIFLIIGLMF